jgi:hypothetical protein
MCDERISSQKKNLQCVAKGVPKIILQRVDEIWPAVKESLVSVLYICVGEIVGLTMCNTFGM